MNLLVVAARDQGNVEDFLSVLVELDVAGLEVLESSSVMQVLARHAPIFAGLRQLITRPKTESRIILGLTENDDILLRLDALLRKIGLDLGEPGVGYAILVPTAQWIGHLDFEAE